MREAIPPAYTEHDRRYLLNHIRARRSMALAMNDLPGRGDVNPYGIPMPNPHEREGPDEDDVTLPSTAGEPGQK